MSAQTNKLTRELGLAPGKHKAKPESVEEAEASFYDLIKYSGKAPASKVVEVKSKGKGKNKGKTDSTQKIVLINDLHVPYHDEAALAEVINTEAHDTDLLIIGGDLLDLFSVSRYEKFNTYFPLSYELTQGKAVINTLASHFKKIKIIPGNHDERWKKHLLTKRGLSPFELESMNMLAKMANHDETFDITDPLYCLVRDLPNVELMSPVVKDYAHFSFFHQEGDIIVSHAEKFSRTPNAAAAGSAFWFQSFGIPTGICQPFKVLAQAHTHQFGMTYGNYGIWNLECGCLCKTPDYAANPKLMGSGRPSTVGYTVFYQKDGVTDMKRSRLVPIHH